MASHPPKQCCTIGVKHEGKPVGEYVDIDGINAYITYPENTTATSTHKKAILLLPDVMGEKALNAQLIADQYASNGYLCLLIDLFHGDPVPEPENRPTDFNLQDWRKNHGVESTDPITEKAIKVLRGKYGVEKLGAVGYCFGAKPLVRYLRRGKGLIDVGFVAHPSFVDGEELEKIEGALSIAAAQTDQIFPVEKRQESEAILSKLSVPWQINLYSGVSHGFAVRGDLSDPKVKFAKEQAFLQAVHWFDQWIEA